MLTDKDLVIASATMLTGILLVFTLFDFSINEQVTYYDNKFQLEETQKELNNITNRTAAITILFLDPDPDFRGLPELLENIGLEIYGSETYDYIVEKGKLETKKDTLSSDIQSYEETKTKEQLLLSPQLNYMFLILYSLSITAFVAILHSALSPKFTKITSQLLLLSHVFFMFTWILVFFLAMELINAIKFSS